MLIRELGEDKYKVLNQYLFPNNGVMWDDSGPLSLSCFRSLQPGVWLSDAIINLMLDIYHSIEPKVITFYTTFFATKLLGEPSQQEPDFNYMEVASFSTNAFGSHSALFDQEVIAIPINKNGNHWVMVTVHPREKHIYYWDSKHGNGEKLCKASWTI